MTTSEALEILVRVLARPVHGGDEATRHASLSFGATNPGGHVEVTLTTRRGDEVLDEKIQELPVLPPNAPNAPNAPNGADVDPAAYEAFAEGLRLALARCDVDATMPHDLLRVNVVRVAGLRDPEAIAAVILDREARRRALATLEVADLGREHGLAPVADARARAALWTLANDETVDEAEEAARWLREASQVDTIPYAIVLLEQRQETMASRGGLSWIADDGRNVDVTIARILEPLVRRTTSPEEQRRVDTLEVVGLFDPAHEHAAYEWMFET